MAESFICWQCGAELKGVILPMSRREECADCRADQHVCKMCVHLDQKGFCREDRAEDQSDQEKANFCDYFSPANNAYAAADKQKALDAKAKLAALFGDPVAQTDEQGDAEAEQKLTPAEIAEQKLRDMLGD